MRELSREAKRLFEDSQAGLVANPARLARVSDALAKRLASEGQGRGVSGNFARSLRSVHWVGIGLVLMGVGTFVAVGRQPHGPVAVAARTRIELAPPAAAQVAPSPGRALAAAAPERVDEDPKLRAAADSALAPQPRAARKSAEAAPAQPSAARAPRALRRRVRERKAAAIMPPSAAPSSAPETAEPTPEPSSPDEHQLAEAPARHQAVSADTALANELQLMRRARAALDDHAATRTLDLLAQHASLYPRGTLYQERLALRALALCALRRSEEAEAARAKLLQAAPRSPYWMRINSACKSAPPSRLSIAH